MTDNYREIFKLVLNDLILATHCHSCSTKYHVSLLGYGGTFCCKLCWHHFTYSATYEETGAYSDFDGDPIYKRIPPMCDFGNPDCEHFVSLANTKYNDRTWENSQNPSGLCWPMKDYRIPCYNECIRNKKTIDTGYIN